MKRVLFLSAIFMLFTQVIKAQNENFFYDRWQPKDIIIEGYEPVEMPEETSNILVEVSPNSVINKISPNVYGTNSVIWATRLFDQPKLVGHLKYLDAHLIRFPGGSLSDTYFWNMGPTERPSDIPTDLNFWGGQNTDDWSMSLEDYYKLLDSANAEGSICINYAYARYGLGEKPLEQAAHLAAEWVRYDNGRTTYWELGNENFGDWEAGYEIDTDLNQDGQPQFISGSLYGQHYKIFADSMKHAATQIGHEIKLGAVAVESDAPWNNVAVAWNNGLMQAAGEVIDYYIIHTYFTPYQEDSRPDVILKSAEIVSDLKNYVLKDLEKAGKPVKPIAMTEWNINAVGSWQQVSNINGLHAVLSLGEFIRNDFGQVMRWDIVNWWENGNDHGMFSYGGEPGVPVWNPRPSFYYMYYFQKMFGDRTIESTVKNDADIIAYASNFNSGEIGVVLANRSPNDKIVTIKPVGYRPVEYMMYSLKGESDNYPFSRKVTVNGYGSNQEGGGPENYVDIKPLGNTVKDKSIKVNVPGYGAVFIAMSLGDVVTDLNPLVDSGISIFPNPSRGDLNIKSNFEEIRNVEFFDMNGRLVLSYDTMGKEVNFQTKLDRGVYLLKIITVSQVTTDLIIFN